MPTNLTLEDLRTELAPIKATLGIVQARTDGLPLIGNATETLRCETRLLKAAINDIGKTNITAGEVEARHTDIDRVQTEQLELATRLATIERLLQELNPHDRERI